MAPRPDAPALLAAAVAALPGGTMRDGQVAMAAAVAAAFTSGEHLLVQAGTGTGKSLAYLAGALSEERRTVVATATLALQSQLVHVDAPRMAAAVEPLLGRRPEVALLKGRSNYLCLLQLNQSPEADAQDELYDGVPSSRLEGEGVRLRSWAGETTTGDRDELDWSPSPRAWSAVSVLARDCVGALKCPYGEQCFAEVARDRARRADIVVTNHSLLALDVLTDVAILPEHDAVVVDEAHELVDRVTNQAADQLTDRGVRQAFGRAGSLLREETQGRLDDAAAGLRGALAATSAGRLTALSGVLAGSLELAASAAARAAGEIPAGSGTDEDDAARRQQARTRLLAVADVARRIADLRDGDVVWVEPDPQGEPVLKVAPLDVSARLASGLFGERPVVATSATLTVGGSFEPLARAVGLAAGTDVQALPWRGLDVGSPFGYRTQARLYVPTDLPDPTPGGPSEEVLAELAALVEAAGGRTLGLFTAQRAAELAAAAMRARLDVPVLLQGEAPLPSLVRQFRADAPTCLFGTLSLWQGVDAPGSACTLVVIDRIPFYRPDDPLPRARREAADARGGSGFQEVSVAHAAVLLAQGAGRLIRAAGDRGLVAVLDRRLRTRRYGTTLLASLPPFAYLSARDDALHWLRQLDSYAPPPLPVPAQQELEQQLADVDDEPG